MTIKTYTVQFDIKDKVYIKELERYGLVTSIFIGKSKESQYLIRYFDNGSANEVYFYDFELE